MRLRAYCGHRRTSFCDARTYASPPPETGFRVKKGKSDGGRQVIRKIVERQFGPTNTVFRPSLVFQPFIYFGESFLFRLAELWKMG